MLRQIRIQRYKSLYDVTIQFEPLTVLIGPNGSGKSNVCEALLVFSNLLANPTSLKDALSQLASNNNDWQAKFWQGDKAGGIQFEPQSSDVPVNDDGIRVNSKGIVESSFSSQQLQTFQTSLKGVVFYSFDLSMLSQQDNTPYLHATGRGLANALTAILLDDRRRFEELEKRFIQLVPNIARISLKNEGGTSKLRLVDRYSEHLIPVSDISDGTLRILAFLAALYQVDAPSIICFEEPENGIHPWLLNKMIDLLCLVSTQGILGKPIQVIITTHSPLLLNYVEPAQVRAVELDHEGKTQIHPLPVDSTRFQAALEAYNHELGELWFTNIFGGNPK